MTGQLALDFGPVPVVEARQRRRRGSVRRVSPSLRKGHMWWRGRRRRIANVPLALAGAL